ncbi:MAG: DUF5050 domain-containing protein [Defluviitaleaceae bacterium]|nr:DUF5050 domain-containing protein [Defluviitaleaceae bacterium]
MALDIQLDPYVIDSVLVRDSYLTHYKAAGAGRAQFIATEFYPTYMADRTPNHSLKISERFTKEFQAELESFKDRAAKMSEMKGAILPIHEVVERNNTAYVIRRVSNFVTVESYMNAQKMPYDEAFLFIRPLMISLAQAQANGVVFNFSIKDLRVTPQRQLMLDAVFAWDMNFHPSLIEIVKLYFKLITGQTYSKEKSNVKDLGVTIPARLDDIINEVLSGNEILYGSLDDFYKKFKSVLDMEAGNAAANSTASGRMMGVAARVLFFLVIVSMAGMVYGGITAFRASNRWANPDRFADTSLPTPSRFDFTGVALTHPRDAGDAIGGCFHFYDIYLFYRSDWGRPVLARRRIEERLIQIPGVVSTEDETIFVDNVLPSFINTWVSADRGGFILFANGLSDNRVYRATLSGSDRGLTRVSENTALNLIVVGDYLYYSNYDNGHFLYRIDLNTWEDQPVVSMRVHTTTTDGENLYFLSGPSGGPFGVFALDPDEPTLIRQLAANAGMVLFYEEEALYFNDHTTGNVRAITTDGDVIRTWEDINVHTFTLEGPWLIFTESGHLIPRAVHIRRGDGIILDATQRMSYIWARNGVLYGLDYVNNQLTHMIQLP